MHILLILFAVSSYPLNRYMCILYPLKHGGLSLATVITIQKFYILPRKCIYLFLMVLIKTTIISLHSAEFVVWFS